jgi:multidrug efflux pump subunit AcrA (membrane-fusion protein)
MRIGRSFPTAPSPLAAAGSIDGARALVYLLLIGGLAAIISLFVTPWRQSVRGAGRVTAYAPLERRQSIEAPVKGRVIHWHVQEGEHVEAGASIVDLADNDPDLLDRLRRERDAIRARGDAAALTIVVADAKIVSIDAARTAAVSGAQLESQIARDKLEATQRALEGATASAEVATLNLERQQRLHTEGLASTRTRELAELKRDTTLATLEMSRASLSAAKRHVRVKVADLAKIEGTSGAKVEDARASLQKAKVEKAKAEADLAKIDVQLARQRQMLVTAPRAGTVFKLLAKEGGEVVKPGDTLAVLVPDVSERAVELWVDGNDAPLITEGREVRLHFEGWPVVQFVGWPSVAVGTFGGRVAFVDATDNGVGQFRIVVVPSLTEPWPESRYLRQGVRANGWVLLNQVSLGYELWRLFNGFPPAIAPPSEALKTESK